MNLSETQCFRNNLRCNYIAVKNRKQIYFQLYGKYLPLYDKSFLKNTTTCPQICEMNIHIGKVILKKLKESGMSKSEFGRRINKSPQNVQDIFTRQSIDTKLLLDISEVLEYSFFTLYLKDADVKQLGEAPQAKDKLAKLNNKVEKLEEINLLLKKQ